MTLIVNIPAKMVQINLTKILSTAFFCLFIASHICYSQYYTSGIDPASVKWRQINTKNFTLIYPTTFEEHAQYIANGLEYAYAPCSKTIHPSGAKISSVKMPVIIHNQTTIPSSVTPYAPKRMDFFTTPPQDMYPQDWVDQLIIHEFRHASQYAAVNQGFTKTLTYLCGEQSTILTIGLFVPLWLIEGDATVMETALHKTGRGRTPSFEMKLHAQFVDKGIYSYEKANNGSFRDFVPGKYELGYQLVGLSRQMYGADIWSKVLSDIGRYPYTFGKFSSALIKQTGLSKYGLYDSLTHRMQQQWKEKDKNLHENGYQILSTHANHRYTDYNLPVLLKDSLIIAVKTVLGDLPQVVRIDTQGKEKKLFTTGANYLLESMSSSDSNLYWSEMVNDPRWSFRDYRVIKSYNYHSGKIKQLTHGTRYYAPSVTADGKYITAVEVTLENKYNLVILDATDCHVIKKITTPDNLLFIHPRWSPDGKSIISVVLGKEGNSLAKILPELDSLELLLPYSFMEIKQPSFLGDSIIYQASYNGTDNIYCLDPQTHIVAQLTSARFGAATPCPTMDNSAIIYSNYTSDGYRIVKEKLTPEKWKIISIPDTSAFSLAEKLTQQENFIFDSDSVPDLKYQSKPYRKSLRLFNFHSWAPIGVDIQNITARPGITLLSQNLLSTNITSFGYLYDRNQKTNKYYLSLTNESLFPAFDLNIDYGNRRHVSNTLTSDSIPATWNESNLSTGVRLPLKWSHNFWVRSFEPKLNLTYKFIKEDESISFKFEYPHIISLSYVIKATNQIKKSNCDLYPHWGQDLQLNYNHTPFEEKPNSILSGQLTLDFPGIFKYHGLRLYGAYQKRNQSYYPFSDLINFPRCHDNIFSNEIYSFSTYYSMPICCPDWRLGHFLYIKRFKTAFFYDFAKSTDHQSPDHFSSTGLDLSIDFTLFNFIAPFDAGIRTAYIPETKRLKCEFLFTLNINSIY